MSMAQKHTLTLPGRVSEQALTGGSVFFSV
jgi:hypothetical protein